MNSNLFTPAKIGTMLVPNRLIRSATVERMADVTGKPTDKMKALWAGLAEGGVGLIITGHMYVHPSGKASPEMAGIYSDSLVPALAECVQAVHNAGISQSGRMLAEGSVAEEDWENHLIFRAG